LSRFVEGSLFFSLSFCELLINLYRRFRFEELPRAVRPVAPCVLLPFQRLLAAPFLVELQARARAVLRGSCLERRHGRWRAALVDSTSRVRRPSRFGVTGTASLALQKLLPSPAVCKTGAHRCSRGKSLR
tara:strand:- start:73 stop:462 length:390 start_codon:yes stop_codon:yes gene_type:complete